MHKLSLCVALPLAVALVFGCVLPVAAADEAIDWSQVDLRQVNFYMLTLEEWDSLADWLRTSADFSDVMYVRKADGVDGEFSSLVECVIADRFIANPQEVLTALAEEEENVWRFYVSDIVYGTNDYAKFLTILRTFIPAGPNVEKETTILNAMLAYAQESYPPHIFNPKTGDPVMLAAAVMTLAGIGGGALIRKKS